MTEITHYAIRYHGGPKGSGRNVRAHIHLFDARNHLVGSVDFYDEGHPLLSDHKDRIIHMALPSTHLRGVVDMLRHEKPIYLAWQETLQNAYLGTSQEPVGEAE